MCFIFHFILWLQDNFIPLHYKRENDITLIIKPSDCEYTNSHIVVQITEHTLSSTINREGTRLCTLEI